MRPGKRFGLSAVERSAVWRPWKAGETLREIGHAFDKPHTSIRCLLLPRGGKSIWFFSQQRYLEAVECRSGYWVFANPATGKPYWLGRVQENWLVPAAKKLGIGRIGWHTFRHSHSTLLHALGVDLKVQQELLRHADVRTTLNIYTQAVPSALREANSKVVRLVIPAQVA